MNELLKAMALDMNVLRYKNETDDSYTYRLLYSALGQWCLRSAAASDSSITKHSQTIILNGLLEEYLKLFPRVIPMFETRNVPVSVFFRRVYEETGYLLTDENNNNHIANYGIGVEIDNGSLYFGICENATVCGLGIVIGKNAPATKSWREVLIRDEIKWDQFISHQFDIVLFQKRDIQIEELQFFNPLSLNSPSTAWTNAMTTEWTVARKTPTGPFYKVLKCNDEILFCEEQQNVNPDELVSYEYRRLYFALRKYYDNPLKAQIKLLDDEYSELTISGHLPNREYYLLLLCSWPDNNVYNKNRFIIKNETVSLVKEILNNLAIDIKEF